MLAQRFVPEPVGESNDKRKEHSRFDPHHLLRQIPGNPSEQRWLRRRSEPHLALDLGLLHLLAQPQIPPILRIAAAPKGLAALALRLPALRLPARTLPTPHSGIRHKPPPAH